MVEKIVWKNEFNIGNKAIDEQHQYLLSLLNELLENRRAMNISELKHVFNSLIHYANIHFHDEEQLMIKYKYPNFSEHKNEHRVFIDKLEALEVEFQLDNKHVSYDIIFFLYDWLIKHILVSDKDFAPFLYKEEFL